MSIWVQRVQIVKCCQLYNVCLGFCYSQFHWISIWHTFCWLIYNDTHLLIVSLILWINIGTKQKQWLIGMVVLYWFVWLFLIGGDCMVIDLGQNVFVHKNGVFYCTLPNNIKTQVEWQLFHDRHLIFDVESYVHSIWLFLFDFFVSLAGL